MIGHLGLNVPDLAAAKIYYDALAPLIGFEPHFAAADECAYRPAGGKPGTYLFLYPAKLQLPYSRAAVGLQHLAFMVKTHSDVRRIHRHVTRSKGTVLHAPCFFAQYKAPYYATFWLDPFGFKLEAVCHHERD